MPCSGPRVRPRFRSPSTSFAFLMAVSRKECARALYEGPIFSRRSQKAFVNSTAENSLARSLAESSPILAKKMSPDGEAMGSGLEAGSGLDRARKLQGGDLAGGGLKVCAGGVRFG